MITLASVAASCAADDDLVLRSADPVGAPPPVTTPAPPDPPDPAGVPSAERVDEASMVGAAPPIAPDATRDGSTLRLAFTGDTLAHSPLWWRAADNAGGTGFDFFPMFASIAPRLSAADLAICHLETPIAPEGEEYTTSPLYGVPAEIVTATAQAGFDRCSTASNHVADRGATGIDRTVEVLEAAGLGQSGMARTPDEIEPRVFDVGGVVMSHLSYTYDTNGIPLPSGEPWRTALIDPQRIVADARRARELGSRFTIVSMHWGEEKESEPSAEQRAWAEAITASGAIDLVVGHHAHVVQPIEQVNGVWVLFGLGNILSNLPVGAPGLWPAASQDAVIAEVDLTVSAGTIAVGRPVVHPTWVDKGDGYVVREVAAALADPSIGPGTRSELERSLDRTATVLGEFFPATLDGAVAPV